MRLNLLVKPSVCETLHDTSCDAVSTTLWALPSAVGFHRSLLPSQKNAGTSSHHHKIPFQLQASNGRRPSCLRVLIGAPVQARKKISSGSMDSENATRRHPKHCAGGDDRMQTGSQLCIRAANLCFSASKVIDYTLTEDIEYRRRSKLENPSAVQAARRWVSTHRRFMRPASRRPARC